MASFYVILRLAIATLWESKLRSILTLIGMVFGTAAVIATLSSNDGAQRFIAKQMASLGNKLMTITSTDKPVSSRDVRAIERYADEIDVAVLESVAGDASLKFQQKTAQVATYAVSDSYFKAMNLELAIGRSFLNQEVSDGTLVAIVGHKVREELFGRNSFVNRSIALKLKDSAVIVRVIGAFKEKGGPSGTAFDHGIFIPAPLGMKLLDQSLSSRLILVLKDDNRSMIAKNQVRSLLAPKFKESLQVSDAREAIERTKAIWAKQNFVGICLAVVSLLTGGVGIMNIMLLSIHQRQKEIGLRKAVGALNSEIAIQFLLESILICLLGGLGGVVAGVGFGHQVARMLGDWEAVTSLQSIAISLGFSVLTGIVFGLIPALRAARIDPYDALRTG